jgi:Spy/CpxP family protein refolding chaperone
VNLQSSKTGMRIVALVSLVFIAAFALGCGGADSGSQSPTLGVLSSDASGGTPRFSPPPYTEIADNVSLRPDQAEAMEKAVEKWREAVSRQWEAHQTRRAGGVKPERGAMRNMADHESPMLVFLEESSDILDAGQFAQLAAFLSEHRDANRQAMEQKRPDKGQRPEGHPSMRGEGPGPMFGGLADELDLTEEQQAQIAEAQKAMHEAMQQLRTQYEDARNNEEFRAKAKELRDAMQEKIHSILTEEQLAQLEQLREDRQAERQAQHEQMVEIRLDRHVEFLTKVLDLTDAQSLQVKEILTTAHDQTKTLMESAREDETARENIRDALKNIRDEAASAIKGILTADQVTVFDALKQLMPGDRGPGPGGHPRGFGRRHG